MIGMKLVLKPLPLFLFSLLWLAACSSVSGSDRAQPMLPFKSVRGPTSLVSTNQASPDDQGAVNTDKLVSIAGEPSAGSQGLSSDESSSANYSVAPIDADSIALVKEIQALTAQRQADLVPAAPGWLHLIIRQFHSKVEAFSADNTSSGQLQLEQWLSLDDQGRVRADIRRLLDDPAQAGEFNLLSGGSWVNLPLAGFSTASNTLPFDPSYGIYDLVDQLVRQGQTLTRSTLYKECWYQGEKYTLSDGRITHEIVFKPDNHALRWIKTWQVSSGVITLVDSLEIALEERLSLPPDDILALAGQTSP